MNRTPARLSARRLPVVLALAAACFGSVAHAAVTEGSASAKARFEQERAACMDGRSHQDRATCLREANNAYDEAKRPRSDAAATTPGNTALERNALARCERVQPADREDCRRMALGGGTRSGSVEGGGVIKEVITVVPAK